MSRFAYVNGRFVRHGEAAVHIEDRGYQLADGVYEVVGVRDLQAPGRLPDDACGVRGRDPLGALEHRLAAAAAASRSSALSLGPGS